MGRGRETTLSFGVDRICNVLSSSPSVGPLDPLGWLDNIGSNCGSIGNSHHCTGCNQIGKF